MTSRVYLSRPWFFRQLYYSMQVDTTFHVWFDESILTCYFINIISPYFHTNKYEFQTPYTLASNACDDLVYNYLLNLLIEQTVILKPELSPCFFAKILVKTMTQAVICFFYIGCNLNAFSHACLKRPATITFALFALIWIIALTCFLKI